jgi:4'-phosphopantetheinyl transferase EntD
VLQRDLHALAVPGLLLGHRIITAGDENALREPEAASLSRVADARRASGAARIVARELLARLGYSDAHVPRGTGREPIWPAGIVGSLAHDDELALAAVALQRDFASVGIDVEPARELPADMRELIASPNELRAVADDPLKGKLLFAAKEAVYKACYPLDHEFLEFGDIEVDFANSRAITRTGRTVSLHTCVSSRIVVVALIAAAQAQSRQDDQSTPMR